MDPWSSIGNGIEQGFSDGMASPESRLHQLFKRLRGGANPAAFGTVQQQMGQPAEMAFQQANANFMGGNQGPPQGFGQPQPNQMAFDHANPNAAFMRGGQGDFGQFNPMAMQQANPNAPFMQGQMPMQSQGRPFMQPNPLQRFRFY